MCCAISNGMAGYFWNDPDGETFGAFTPSLGCGLYHIASREQAPGMKLWVYGTGKHEHWSHAISLNREAYAEIQAGPLVDQSVKAMLLPGHSRTHTEFWRPAASPLDIRKLAVPAPELPSEQQIPLFGWSPRDKSAIWLELLDAYRRQITDAIPEPPDMTANNWPPSGMDELGDALRWTVGVYGNDSRREGEERGALWRYQLGLWLAQDAEKRQKRCACWRYAAAIWRSL